MSYRNALEIFGRALQLLSQEFRKFSDRTEGSIRGLHGGIAEAHGEVMGELARVSGQLREINGHLANLQIAANTVPVILERLEAVEREIGIFERPSNGSNGSA